MRQLRHTTGKAALAAAETAAAAAAAAAKSPAKGGPLLQTEARDPPSPTPHVVQIFSPGRDLGQWMSKLATGDNEVNWVNFSAEEHSMFAEGAPADASDSDSGSDATSIADSRHSQAERAHTTPEEIAAIRKEALERIKAMTTIISTDRRKDWTSLRCKNCDTPRKMPQAIWNRENIYYCSPPCWVAATKEEGEQVGSDRAIWKYTEEFRKLAKSIAHKSMA